MSWLNPKLESVFQSLQGFESLLPVLRLKNRPALLALYGLLLKEPKISQQDLKHLERIVSMADQIVLPQMNNAQTLVDAEVLIASQLKELNRKETYFALRYWLFLKARHGQATQTASQLKMTLLLARILESFPQLEQPVISSYATWQTEKGFAPISVYENLKELVRLHNWMRLKGLNHLAQLSEQELSHYLAQRRQLIRPASHKRAIERLKPFFYYWKDRIDGTLQIPKLAIKRWAGASVKAGSHSILTLWQALQTGHIEDPPALMLAMALGYGLYPTALSLLQLTHQPGQVLYTTAAANRLGSITHKLDVPIELDWMTGLWQAQTQGRQAGDYLFFTPYSQKRQLPVDRSFIEDQLARVCGQVLGQAVPPGELARGALSLLARQSPLVPFMAQARLLHYSRTHCLTLWLESG